MSDATPGSWRKLLRFFEAPHPALLEAGAGGERLVANTRLVFWLFIGLGPLSSILTGRSETPPEVWISLVGVIVAILIAIAVIVILRSRTQIHSIGFVTGTVDVSIVTGVLAAVALIGRPEIAAHSQVAWAVYLLGIVTASLRFDARICLFVGAVAFVEYLAFLACVYALTPVELTAYDMLTQTARLALMVAATAIAIGIVHRSRYLVEASGTDRLTGLASRAYFEERLAAELSRSRRSAEPLCLVLFDIDRFKEFNDRFGHDVGDLALKMVADLLTESKRQQDFLARWGGEEIALILPDTEIDGAAEMADRMRKTLSASALEFRGQSLSLTTSGGIAEFPADGADSATLFHAADRRLLTAKQRGRDRIVYSDPGSD
ncbi:MAG: GGDEF domain-containing protein [Xanthomonadales bacterium]|nr:GGDEF domain-containing protein [Xanthomonadales bacterium]